MRLLAEETIVECNRRLETLEILIERIFQLLQCSGEKFCACKSSIIYYRYTADANVN